jgi:small subunit ribosomal protein S3
MAMEKHFIQEGKIRSEVENFLRTELDGAGYSGINIQKTPLATRVVLYVEKPPLVIGKKGKRIDKITKFLKTRYGIENPAIDVQRVETPTLDPNIVARRIAHAIERGMNRRRVVYKALKAVMNSGAKGVEIILAGKIIGKGGRSRSEKYSEGYMKKAGDSLKLVSMGSTQSYLKAGVIGVTVKIVPPYVVFPDQFSIKLKEGEKPAEQPIEEPKTEGKPKPKRKSGKKSTTESSEDVSNDKQKGKDQSKKESEIQINDTNQNL